ncbi:hypothetical protein VP01_1863g1 [Puccinia sorghi]|uniref:Uncharacterized protein n=1 Tax=Puccinia sorghi TaxID=27349 RepID=A0A0L6VDY0_9BASI|nr:hypothetical protein VP01_1863g1 [Puccinia sorghi]
MRKARNSLIKITQYEFRRKNMECHFFSLGYHDQIHLQNPLFKFYPREQETSSKHLHCYNLLFKCPRCNEYTRNNRKKVNLAKNKRVQISSSKINERCYIIKLLQKMKGGNWKFPALTLYFPHNKSDEHQRPQALTRSRNILQFEEKQDPNKTMKINL